MESDEDGLGRKATSDYMGPNGPNFWILTTDPKLTISARVDNETKFTSQSQAASPSPLSKLEKNKREEDTQSHPRKWKGRA